MGFDIHGINPVIHDTKYPTFNKYSDMDWKEKNEIFKKDTKLEDKYFTESYKREEDNKGIYFRNNCWWWRPLWSYVCHSCKDILDYDDIEGGGSNSGHIITEEKSSAIAKRLFELIASGDTKECEDSHRTCSEKAKIENEGLSYGDKGYNWADSYPFDVENVRNFATFCSESGGFSIC